MEAVTLTQALAVDVFGEQEDEHDSNQAKRGSWQAASEQNLTFPRFTDS
jgi:hypothetical protein